MNRTHVTHATVTFAPLLGLITLVGTLALAASTTSCTSADGAKKRTTTITPKSVLSTMGFALSDDGDPTTPSGDVTATFNAPVVNADGSIDQLGTAHAAFTNPDGSDDGSRDLSSATITNAYADSDVVYAVLFDNNEPWRYVVVAAHAAAIVDGADVVLDGTNAAALVVDENGASGFLSSSGTFHVDSANLAAGGALAGSVTAQLVEVGLASWPDSLFPFSDTGAPDQRATSSGSGTFTATTAGDGTSSVTVDVDGFPTFTGGLASLEPADSATSVIVIADADSTQRRMLAIFVDNAQLVANTTIDLGGYVAGAELLEDDGTTIAFVAGSLALSAADASSVTGSLTLSGDAYVIPADQSGGPTGGDPNGGQQGQQDCTGIDTLASTFAPTTAEIDTASSSDQMPTGFDRVITFTDGNTAMFGLLLASDVDLHAGSAYAFSTVDFEGRSFPAAVLAIATCDQEVSVDSGTLTATLDDATQTLAGTLSYVVAGSERDVTFNASVIAGPTQQ